MRILSFFRNLFRRRAVEQALDDELLSSVELLTQEKMKQGLSQPVARREALIELGGVEQVKEEVRATRAGRILEDFIRDIRFAVRILSRSPGFTTVAVLTLALGIGANATIFSVVNAVLLEPLAYPEPQQLVAIHQQAPGAAGLANFSEGLPLSPSMYFTYAEHNRTFQSLGVWTSGAASVTGVGQPERVRAVYVSSGVLESLDVPPEVGRWLSTNDQEPHGAKTVMLSYGYWQRRFGGSRSVIGRTIDVDSQLREIVGVMPAGFRVVGTDFDLLIPLAFDRGKLILAGFGYQGIGRLKPGTSISRADADIARLVPVWMRSWSNGPGSNPLVYAKWRITPDILPLKSQVVGNVASDLWVIMAMLGIVMLIACANVANLFLVKIEARQRELTIRAVLGAPMSRIVGELLLECMTIGLLGGAAGLALADAGVRLLRAIAPANLPRLNEISVGTRTFEFTLALAVLSALLFGLFAVVRHARGGIAAHLRSESRTSSLSRERHRTRNALVVTQVAMAFVLLVSAGLMIRTFQHLRKIDPGFTGASHLELMRISIPDTLIPQPLSVVRTQNEIVDKLRAIPGVNSVGFASEAPMEGFGSNWDQIRVEGKTYSDSSIPPLYLYEYVSPHFFQTMGTRLIAGRELTWTDVYDLRPVGIVSENLARELWGSPANAVGKRFREFPGEPWRQVVGVVQDVFQDGVGKKAPEIVYWPTLGRNLYGPAPANAPPDAVRSVTFVVRSKRAGTESFLSEVRRAVWSVNSMLPLASVRTMQVVYDKSLAQTSFALVMLGIAAGMALLLSVIGLYGVLSYVVGRRTHEIGIRAALGAGRQDLLRLVVGQGLKLALIGVAIGISGALVLTRFLSSLLYGVKPTDPVTFVAVSVILAAVALLACYIPARRATKVDPMVALRYE